MDINYIFCFPFYSKNIYKKENLEKIKVILTNIIYRKILIIMYYMVMLLLHLL